MRTHFRYSPSQIARTLKCPGSVSRCERAGEEFVGEAAQRGTRAHELLERLLKGGSVQTSDLAEIDAELVEFVGSCVAWVDQHCRGETSVDFDPARGDNFVELIETTIASRVLPEFGGTPDYVALVKRGDVTGVHVVDMKTGRTPVAAVDNVQLLAYLALVEEKCVAAGVKVNVRAVTILQSGAPPDTWAVPRDKLYAFMSRLEAAMASTDLRAGSHCQWCRARAECPAAEVMARQALLEDFSDNEPARLERLLDVAPAIRSILDDVPRKMLRLAETGVKFSGYKVVQGLGHRRWKSGIDPLEALRAKKILRRVIVEEKVKSPAQLDREGYGELIADLVERPSLPPTLVPRSDRRPEVELLTPAEEFSAV